MSASGHTIEALFTSIDRASDAHALFAVASTRLREISPFDAAVWVATDPLNGLTTAPVRVENLPEGGCGDYWETELSAEHVNTFRDLARASVPVAGLREATGDRPASSSLYRKFMCPRGFDDELRAVLRVDGQRWGHLSLFRERGRHPFRDEDIALVHAISVPMARRLRSFARPVAGAPRDLAATPGMLLFDTAGSLVSINDEARHLLAEMPVGPALPTEQGIALPLPTWVLTTAGHTRMTGENARIRVRTRTGRWLVCHASSLRDSADAAAMTALVLAPARPTDVASLIVAAYALTDREVDVTELIARGLSTAQIAAQLFLSAHTVRDHVKAIFEKVGVTSRGELVAKLFTDHYEPTAARNTLRIMDGDMDQRLI
ncbi:helix-turn-helix transcriptional regulator [Nocardia abscessus]|uniref:helix-turn-helix domain-containing protein n=1 Tax=Nocardia abscessus TaxID=120957 RepID=UPI0018937B2D|nr:helix-turn-helix transcriptional regulator [Nocardia abscessus]MBF6335163.1 helix-turn-helix transcriptional regulator [Nocardia abscessus]